jgi:hypothetical protein
VPRALSTGTCQLAQSAAFCVVGGWHPAERWLGSRHVPAERTFRKRAICFRTLTALPCLRHSPNTTTPKQSDCVIAREQFRWRAVHVAANTLGPSKDAAIRNGTLGSITGRDEFIIAEALAKALVALKELPPVQQPTRNIADMKMLLNSLYPPSDVSIHLTTARWRFLPNSSPAWCARGFKHKGEHRRSDVHGLET